MVFLVAVLVGGAFGGADQYLGSIPSLSNWGAPVSLLSAPWLVLPFLFGCTQGRPRRAAAVGLVASLAALATYFLLIMSPFEGGRSSFTGVELHGLLVSNLRNIVAAMVAGPLYGWLGQQWRTRRSPWSAALVAGALLLEPAVLHVMGGHSSGSTGLFDISSGPPLDVALTEAATGAATGVYFCLRRRQFLRTGPVG
jgi:hypothetical protein